MLLDLRSLTEGSAPTLGGPSLGPQGDGVPLPPFLLLQYQPLTAPLFWAAPALPAFDWWPDPGPPRARPLRSPAPDQVGPLVSVEIAPVLSWAGTWPDRLPRPTPTLVSGAPFLGTADPLDWVPFCPALHRTRPVALFAESASPPFSRSDPLDWVPTLPVLVRALARPLSDATRLREELADLGLTWTPTLPADLSRRRAAPVLALPSLSGTADPFDWLPTVPDVIRCLVASLGTGAEVLRTLEPSDPPLAWAPMLPSGVVAMRRVSSADPSLTTWEVILLPPAGPAIVLGVVAILGDEPSMTTLGSA